MVTKNIKNTILSFVSPHNDKKGLKDENRAEAKHYPILTPHPTNCFLRLILVRREINRTGWYVKALFLYSNVGRVIGYTVFVNFLHPFG